MTESTSHSLADDQLMRRLAKGEIELLGVLYVRYDAMVKAALFRSAPEISMAEVEELTQDVFLAVMSGASRYVEQASFKAWLYAIAVRKARVWQRNTWLRRRILRQKAGKNAGLALKPEGSSVHRMELRHAIVKALEVLPSGQREVLLLHAVEGFNSEEIAKILGIQPKTVRTRLFRARKKLLDNIHADIWSAVLDKEDS